MGRKNSAARRSNKPDRRRLKGRTPRRNKAYREPTPSAWRKVIQTVNAPKETP